MAKLINMEAQTMSSKFAVERLASGKKVKFVVEPSTDEIVDLVDRFGFVAIESMRAEGTIKEVAKDGWDVTGHLSAKVTQRCVITGDPVLEVVDFAIEERYVRHTETDSDVEVELDGAEPLVDGSIDLGEMVAQSLGVAVTPWPKSAAASEHLVVEDVIDEHPFAGLAALKKPE